jgi:hypothetical protein
MRKENHFSALVVHVILAVFLINLLMGAFIMKIVEVWQRSRRTSNASASSRAFNLLDGEGAVECEGGNKNGSIASRGGRRTAVCIITIASCTIVGAMLSVSQ